MKKLIAISILSSLFLFSSSMATAQEAIQDQNSSNSRLVFEEGDLSLNLGFSFGLIGYGYYGNRSFPLQLQSNIEYGIHEYIGVGGFVGYSRVSYNYRWFGYGYKYSISSTSFGVQGVFHASTFMNEVFDFSIDDTKVDFYGKVLTGIEIFSTKYDGEADDTRSFDNDTRIIFGPVLGVRYMFSPNFGGYAEAGRGINGWLSLGVSLKL